MWFQGTIVFLGAFILYQREVPAQDSRQSLRIAISDKLRFAKEQSSGQSEWGTPFKIKLSGLEASDQDVPRQSHYRNGAVERQNSTIPQKDGAGSRVSMKAGEIVYPERVTVETNSVSLLLVKPKVQAGNERRTIRGAYRALLIVDFPIGFLDTATPEQVMDKVSQVLERQDKQPTPTGRSNRENVVPSKTSNLTGKTVQEMTEVLGNNFTTVIMGKRTIYVYKELGLRIPVENGKVVSGL